MTKKESLSISEALRGSVQHSYGFVPLYKCFWEIVALGVGKKVIDQLWEYRFEFLKSCGFRHLVLNCRGEIIEGMNRSRVIRDKECSFLSKVYERGNGAVKIVGLAEFNASRGPRRDSLRFDQ